MKTESEVIMDTVISPLDLFFFFFFLAGVVPFIKEEQDKGHRKFSSRTQRPGILIPHL